MVLAILAMVLIIISCSKKNSVEPNEPNQPQIEQHDDTIHWNWGWSIGWAPSMDSVAYYTNDPTVRHVYIDLIELPASASAALYQHVFRNARDTLQTRIDIDPSKVRGCGRIRVGYDGAQIHPDTLTPKHGMWEPDSLWFTQHGWRVSSFSHHNKKSVQCPESQKLDVK